MFFEKKALKNFVLAVWFLWVSCVVHASTSEVKSLIKKHRIPGGVISWVGLKRVDRIAFLLREGKFLLHGISKDRSFVQRARRRLISMGLHGRATVSAWDGKDLPYRDDLINVLVLEEEVKESEVMRVLAPGGIAVFVGRKRVIKKPYPEDFDTWTHWLHGPDGNPVAKDKALGPPSHVQWICTPKWARHHDTVPTTNAFVSDGYRVFYISDEAPCALDGSFPDRWFLVARDAFNGVELWRRRLLSWGWNQWSAQWRGRFNIPPELPKRLVASSDKIYVTLGFNAPISEIDSRTGRILRTLKGTEGASEILLTGKYLVFAKNNELRRPTSEDRRAVPKSICVFDLEKGKILWTYNHLSGLHAKYNTAEPFGRLELTVGDGAVFAVDQDRIICLEMESGKERWVIPRPPFREHLVMYGIRMSDQCVVLYSNRVLLFAQPEMKRRRSWHTLPGTLYAFRTSDGKKLWAHRYGGWPHNWQPDVFVINDLVWVHEHIDFPFKGHDIKDKSKVDYSLLGIDLRSGEVKRRISTKKIFNVGHHHRCYREKATVRYVLPSRRGVEFVDIETGDIRLSSWVRGGCLHGFVPCNGFIYATPHPCECYIETSIKGYAALRSKTQESFAPKNLFETGPRYGEIKDLKIDYEKWPTFRHDNFRSGATDTEISQDPHLLWQKKVGAKLTPPVVAEGLLFVADIESFTLFALEASSGNIRWSYPAGSRIDTPPTVCGEVLFFGSSDGWLYCLTTKEGELVWKLRLAPEGRYMCVENRLECVWPLHGSVLFQNGMLYAVSGRSSYLDHGLFAYEIDPLKGKILRRKVIFSPDPKTGRQPEGDAFKIPGTLSDIPVGDGNCVYVRKERIFGSGGHGPHLIATGGLRDSTWFNRIRWIIGSVNDASLLVFSRGKAYGIIAYPPRGRRSAYQPVKKGYTLFSRLYKAEAGRKAGGYLWRRRLPIRFEAFALARGILVGGGFEVDLEGKDRLSPFEGKGPGVICLVSAEKGEVLKKIKIPSIPVWDGIALAYGNIFVSLRDGTLLCLGKTD